MISDVDLLLFEVAGQRFAVDPAEVLRVGRPDPDLPTAELLPSQPSRTLVVRDAQGEFQLPVDRVLGVKRFSQRALRKPPAAIGNATHEAPVMGLVLDGLAPVPIVDLQAISLRPRAAANEER